MNADRPYSTMIGKVNNSSLSYSLIKRFSSKKKSSNSFAQELVNTHFKNIMDMLMLRIVKRFYCLNRFLKTVSGLNKNKGSDYTNMCFEIPN